MYEYIVFDCEATKIPVFKPWHDGAYLCSLCIELPDRTSKVWFFNPLVGDDAEHIKEIQAIVSNSKMLVGQNIKYDLLWFFQYGINFDHCSVWDTMVGDNLLHAQQRVGYDLNNIAARNGFGQKVEEMKAWWENGYETDQIPLDLHEQYVKQDVNLTHQIFLKQREDIKANELDKLAAVTFQMTKLLSATEFNGVIFNKDAANKLCDMAKQEVDECSRIMQEIAGVEFNTASASQLAAVLYGGEWTIDGREEYEVTLKSGIVKKKSRKCKVPVKYPGLGFKCDPIHISDKTGMPSSSSQAVQALVPKNKKQALFLETLGQSRKASKVVSTITGSKEDKGWISQLSSDGRLHSQFNQTVTVTGRLSSSQPNAQNLPRGYSGKFPLKQVFYPEEGNVIVNVDLSSIEWRVAAELSRDPVMIQEIIDGVNIHTANAESIFGVDHTKMDEHEFKELRTVAKTVSFRSLYGGGAYGFFYDSRMPNFSLEKWQEIMDKFTGKYSRLIEWQNENKLLVSLQGYVRTPSGRVLKIDPKEQAAVCNYPVQSFSADVYNLAVCTMMSRLKKLGNKGKLILLVHDSVVFDVPCGDAKELLDVALTTFREIPKLVEDYYGYKFVVPLDAEGDVGLSYGDLHETTVETVEADIQKLLTERESHVA